MKVSPSERREVFGLFNISEAAREIGVARHWLEYRILRGIAPQPSKRFRATEYYTSHDILRLKEWLGG